MRQAVQQRTRAQVSKTTSVPAPVGGLNARDSLAAMPPTDAVTLDNFFPTPTSVDLRKGYSLWATGLPANVESLMQYTSATQAVQFAASGTAFYNVTSQGAVGAPVVTGLSNARWQHANFGTTAGQFLYCVNGVDTPRIYNGTAWITLASTGTAQTISTITRVGTLATLTTASPHGLATGNQVVITGTTPAGFSGTYLITVTGASTFTYTMASDPGGNATVVGTYTVGLNVTGVNPTTFVAVNNFKSRLFFVQNNSLSFWYLPLSSLGGAAQQFDLTPLFRLGGALTNMYTWTVDNGAGVQEYAIFISSQGEVAMYAGTDPGVAANWSLSGMFRLGRPIGRRCAVRVGSDLIVISADGFYPLSKALVTNRSQSQDAISDKIINLVSNDVTQYGNNFGWEAILHPIGDKLIVNVPQIAGSTQYQYVQNTISGAWCRFTGWNANCFGLLNDSLYFGGNLTSGVPNSAFVAVCDTGFSDNGAFINGEAKTAFNYFGAPGQIKSIRMLRPVINTTGRITPSIGVDVDFSDSPPPGFPSFTASSGSLWNVSLWNTFMWADSSNIKQTWQQAFGLGYCASYHMRLVNNASALQWLSVDWVYETGGVI